MEIFDKQIFGKDAEGWLKLCKEEKKEWILKYTNQKDENLINQFVLNPKITKDCQCLNCGKEKVKTNVMEVIIDTFLPENSKPITNKKTTKKV